MRAMNFDGTWTDAHLTRDLLVCLAAEQADQDIALTLRHFTDTRASEVRVTIILIAGVSVGAHGGNRLQQLLVCVGDRQEIGGPRLDDLGTEANVAAGVPDDDHRQADAAYLKLVGDRQSFALPVLDLRKDATAREHRRHIKEAAGRSEDFHRVAGTFKQKREPAA